MTLIERLPLLRPDVQVHYEGSIDKKGGNADWDWWLYQDTNSQDGWQRSSHEVENQILQMT